jgi:hypothetical protein
VLEGGDDTPFDCGAVATAAWSRGLGTVINSQGIMQSPVARVCAATVTSYDFLRFIEAGTDAPLY